MKNDYQKLLEYLVKHSFKYSKDPIFKLVSYRLSNFYIDCKKTTLSADIAIILGQVIFDKIEFLDVKAIGGLTLGADPIAYSTSIVAKLNSKIINPFIIRKKAKDHGIVKWIEGNIEPNDNVVIVDDVITTGQSTIQAVERAKESNLNVIQIITLVDREEGGREEIEKLNIPFCSIYTKTDLFNQYIKEGNVL